MFTTGLVTFARKAGGRAQRWVRIARRASCLTLRRSGLLRGFFEASFVESRMHGARCRKDRAKAHFFSSRGDRGRTVAGVGTSTPAQAVEPSRQMHRFRSPSYASNRGTSGGGVPTPATILAWHGHRAASHSKMEMMSRTEQPSDEQQVGITNAQEINPDTVIADLTKQMNAHFAAGQYSEAAILALQITAPARTSSGTRSSGMG